MIKVSSKIIEASKRSGIIDNSKIDSDASCDGGDEWRNPHLITGPWTM